MSCRLEFSIILLLTVTAFISADAQFKSKPALPADGVQSQNPKEYSKRVSTQSLLFTENRGQVADDKGTLRPDILFTAHSGATKIFLTATGIHYQFTRMDFPGGYEQEEKMVKDYELQEKLRKEIKRNTHHFTLSLEGANANARVRKEEENAYRENFYLAQCPQGITGVRTYSRIVYEDIYPGIDWVVYANERGLKYDFVVHAGADAAIIKLKVQDADEVNISQDGDLIMKTALGEVREKAPQSFCEGKVIVSRFEKREEGTIGFAIGNYDKSKELIVDPSIAWATYYGSSGQDEAYSCAVDKDRDVYVAGITSSAASIASGGFQNTYAGGSYDAFLAKFSGTGSRLWTTYYGSNGNELGYSCATDNNGNVFLTGETNSAAGIASGGFQNNYGGGNIDAFLVKFDNSGVRSWATYYGGNDIDRGNFCQADANGNIYVAGLTKSSSSIASGGYQNTYGDSADAFLVKFSSNGTRLWGTYYGGSNSDVAYVCSVDANKNVYLVGTTLSLSGIASGGFQNTYQIGPNNAFLAKFSSSGTRLWATYYGHEYTNGTCAATDATGNIYLGGTTGAATGIASGGFQNAHGGVGDAFLVKFNSTGTRLWATYYGGGGDDIGRSCVTDHLGNIYLAGQTRSPTGIDSGGFQNSLAGNLDAFIVKFNSAGKRIWGTYYGGTDFDDGVSCAMDGNNIYLAGRTVSSTGIANSGHQNIFGGGVYDAFLLKILQPNPEGIGTTEATNNWTGSITVYPNPATDILTLSADWDANNVGKIVNIELVNSIGQHIYTKEVRPESTHFLVDIPLSNSIAPGLYQLRVSTIGMQASRMVMLKGYQ